MNDKDELSIRRDRHEKPASEKLCYTWGVKSLPIHVTLES